MYQPTRAETPGASSCCALADQSQVYSRLRFGSGTAATAEPNNGLLLGPISLSWAMLSPLVGRIVDEHVDVPGTRLQSSHVRVSPVELIGLKPSTDSADSWVEYLLTLNFSAVLALPKRS